MVITFSWITNGLPIVYVYVLLKSFHGFSPKRISNPKSSETSIHKCSNTIQLTNKLIWIMSHTSSSKYQPQNLPVLKNFNAFEILEPEKVNLEKTDVSTAILVDVSDSTNKLEKSLELSPDLHGSFLDKVSDFDLLDLYQNIYVTPQQIKKAPSNDKNKNSHPDVDPFKIDFTELFEKAEKGKKLSEWTKNNENENSVENTPQVNLTNNSRSLEEILDNAVASKCSKLELKPQPLDTPESDPICEDDIDDFLQPKLVINQSIFKETTPISSRLISSLKNDNHAISLNPYNKGQSLKSLSKPCEACNTDINDGPISVTKISPQELKLQKLFYNVNEITRVPHSTQECHMYENKIKKFSKIEAQSDTPIYCNEIKTSLTDLNSPSVNHITCQKQSIPMLHTAKMDPKVFKNRLIVKNDAEKIGFTKGPDIYEKSVVLPQIMKRLAERKQVLDQQQQMQRKLVLETGVTHNGMQNYDIACVNDRVTSSKASRILKHEEPNKLTPYKKPEGFCNVSKHEELAKLTAINKSAEYFKPEVALKSPAYLETASSVSLKPEVLMEDCSKKRIKALKARLDFEKFVYTGKLPP